MLHHLLTVWTSHVSGAVVGHELSARELELVDLVARGMTNKQIDEVLFISPKTQLHHYADTPGQRENHTLRDGTW
jgi:DNA-binding NarL/FixJ family response regulator